MPGWLDRRSCFAVLELNAVTVEGEGPLSVNAANGVGDSLLLLGICVSWNRDHVPA
jgi:hypothetical protein